jgi:hypothetical protein
MKQLELSSLVNLEKVGGDLLKHSATINIDTLF